MSITVYFRTVSHLLDLDSWQWELFSSLLIIIDQLYQMNSSYCDISSNRSVHVMFVRLECVDSDVLQEVERLSQELSDSRIKQDELTKQVSELQVTNTSLKDLVSNTQTALSKEQNLVKHFQEQVSNSKVNLREFFLFVCSFEFIFLVCSGWC